MPSSSLSPLGKSAWEPRTDDSTPLQSEGSKESKSRCSPPTHLWEHDCLLSDTGSCFKRLGDLHSVMKTLLASGAISPCTGTTGHDFIAEDN